MGAPLDGDFVGLRGAVDYRPRGHALASGPGSFNQTYGIPVTIKHGWV